MDAGSRKMKKLLIVYYTCSNRNTERIAKKLKSIVGGDLLKIDIAVPYSGSYDDVVNQGQDEVERSYEPALKPIDVNISEYDVIVVGHSHMAVHDGSRRSELFARKRFYGQDDRSLYDQRRLGGTCH